MIKLIVGLANYSHEYFNTRHNIGSWYINKLITHYNQRHLKRESRFCGYTGKIFLRNFNVRLLIPDTYMNMSGISVSSIARFYQFFSDEILIVHDELDLVPGCIKLKFSGGHNGHNGIKNIIEKLHNVGFYRLKIGIGRPAKKNLIEKFVLSEPSLYEKEKINQILNRTVHCTEMIISKNISKFVHCINK